MLPFAIPWLITFSLVQNDSLLPGTFFAVMSLTHIQRAGAEETEMKGRQQVSPSGCTQRPFE